MLKPSLGALVLTLLLLLSARGEQTGAARRVLAGDDSTRRLGIVAPDGSLEWEMKIGPIHDASVLPNGNVLCQQGWTRIVEVSRDKQLVWEYDAATMNGNKGRRVEVHAFQRLTNDLTMIVESGPARIIEVDKTGKMHREIKLKVTRPNPHSDTRLARKIANGNYLVAHESDGCVRNMTPRGRWSGSMKCRSLAHAPRRPWPGGLRNSVFSAIRLANGNTLIGTGNGHSVPRSHPAREIVWKIEQNDLPGITLAWVTRVERHSQWQHPVRKLPRRTRQSAYLEVTSDKKVAWTFKDWKYFGNSMPSRRCSRPRPGIDEAAPPTSSTDGSSPESASASFRPGLRGVDRVGGAVTIRCRFEGTEQPCGHAELGAGNHSQDSNWWAFQAGFPSGGTYPGNRPERNQVRSIFLSARN
jgi:hypothetical protein